jgi:arylsulfatase A-like enzyme
MDFYDTIPAPKEAFGAAGKAVQEFVSMTPEAPFFLFLHTYTVHDPYTPEPPYRTLFTDPSYRGAIIGARERLVKVAGRNWNDLHEAFWARVNPEDPADVQHVKDLYDGKIRFVDDQIGVLLEGIERLGVLEDTLTVVLSDHGEEFLDHGSFLHDNVYQELLHVPLILLFPRSEHPQLERRRETAVVRLVDLLPTILEYAGVPIPEHVHGMSLLPLLQRQATPPPVVVSVWNTGEAQALRDNEWKLLRRKWPEPQRELYRVDRDPHEKRDLAAGAPDVVLRLEQQLDEILLRDQAFQARLAAGEKVFPGEETVEQLRALGYLK